MNAEETIDSLLASDWLRLTLGAVYCLAALCSLYRIVVGPTVFDRIVASDVVLVVAMCAIGTQLGVDGRTWTLPLLLVISLFGVIASISVARFLAQRDPEGPETRRSEASSRRAGARRAGTATDRTGARADGRGSRKEDRS